MSPTRRDFLRTTAAAATMAAFGPLAVEPFGQTVAPPAVDAAALELANEALNAAKKAGASYADARVGRYRRQAIATRERQVSGVSDSESYGLGVRTLVDGSWGFAATSTMTRAGAQRAAADAAAMSRAARIVRTHRVELAPITPVTGVWMTPVRRDPLEVPLEEKIALLLAANEAALKVPTVRFASSSLALLREVKTLVDDRGHQRHADRDPRGSCVLGDRCRRRRRVPGVRARDRAARPGLGVHRVARHARATRSAGPRSRPRRSRPEASRPASTT